MLQCVFWIAGRRRCRLDRAPTRLGGKRQALAISAEPEAGDADIVGAAFSDAESGKHEPRYVMKREDGKWRIDNIRSFHAKLGWSDLRQDLVLAH